MKDVDTIIEKVNELEKQKKETIAKAREQIKEEKADLSKQKLQIQGAKGDRLVRASLILMVGVVVMIAFWCIADL